MITKVKFTKMHGTGNDYIYVNSIIYPIPDPAEISKAWSKYHTGIGSDGLVLIGKSDNADFSMHIFNADGSEAKMCGNASRCIGKYVYDNKLCNKEIITLETLSGIKEIKLNIKDKEVKSVTVDMGIPMLKCKSQIATQTGNLIDEILYIDKKKYYSTFISVGNPHLVIFVNDINNVNLQEIGPKIENYSLFPEKVNVEIVELLKDNSLSMRVWERGSGETMACGTGACASLVAAVIKGISKPNNIVRMRGGKLFIEWDQENGHIYMTGEAVKVFDGEVDL